MQHTKYFDERQKIWIDEVVDRSSCKEIVSCLTSVVIAFNNRLIWGYLNL